MYKLLNGEFIQVQIKETVKFKMGLDLAVYVEENMCEYRVNGIKGYGFAECEYRIDPYQKEQHSETLLSFYSSL